MRQHPLLDAYVERFFDEVRGVFRTRDKDFATDFFGALYPHHLPTQDIVRRSEALDAALGEDEWMLRRSLRDALDELQRAQACRAYAAARATGR